MNSKIFYKLLRTHLSENKEEKNQDQDNKNKKVNKENKNLNNFKNKKKNFFDSLKNPPEINKKSTFIKILAFSILIIIIYATFFHGKVKSVFIKSITCENNEKITITDFDGKEFKINFKDYHKHTYSEPIGMSGGQTNHKIFTQDENKQKISFNIMYSSPAGTDGSKSNFFSLDNACLLQFKQGATTGSTTCACCTATDKSCCCKDCAATCTCADGSECACCKFSKLIYFAILNTVNPTGLTKGRVFFSLLPTILYLAVFMYIMRYMAKGNIGLYGKNSIFSIGKSISDRHKSKVTFKDVAGLDEEKEELEEIVDYLKNPKKYTSMGARTPKGVILYGPPGTGKTLLAKAVSGEADVPFLTASGASFDDMFVGVGAKRIRELFEKAKKLSPCIIFIDEIDALAAKRGNKFISGGGGADQTINQFLSELDGFNTQSGVVVIAATNRLSTIDEAVLRPGRFDRHIKVNLPDILERIAIFKIHAKGKNISQSVDIEDVARKTPGFSGAQIENVLNEATLLTVRKDKKVIGEEEINESIDRVIAGPAKKNKKINFEEKKQIAYHESGHAIAGLYASDGDSVEKITIIPRGDAGGYVLSAPKEQESIIYTKAQLLSMILTTLAGRAAEEIFFGKEKISSGASNDLFKATNIAKSMVLKLGMTKIGLAQYISNEEPESPYKNNYSEHYAAIIDSEVQKILQTQYEKAKEIIQENMAEYLLIVETLLLLETIDKKQINYIHENKKIPKIAEKLKFKMFEQKP